MKANELRIGNYILHEPTIDDWEEIIITLPSLLQIDISPESYCGIPLTEEWLLKFGFRFDGMVYRIDEDKYMTMAIVSGKISFPILRNQDASNPENFSLMGVKYVHQLQNLYFSLTGEELQIKK
jgi:hypothetical protein